MNLHSTCRRRWATNVLLAPSLRSTCCHPHISLCHRLPRARGQIAGPFQENLYLPSWENSDERFDGQQPTAEKHRQHQNAKLRPRTPLRGQVAAVGPMSHPLWTVGWGWTLLTRDLEPNWEKHLSLGHHRC